MVMSSFIIFAHGSVIKCLIIIFMLLMTIMFMIKNYYLICSRSRSCSCSPWFPCSTSSFCLCPSFEMYTQIYYAQIYYAQAKIYAWVRVALYRPLQNVAVLLNSHGNFSLEGQHSGSFPSCKSIGQS